jgi:vesicular inhibitory amino acid transporter
MFGDDVADEITSNILKTTGYPRAITFLLCIFIAIIPLTKIPLNARPIISTLEVISGVHQHPYLPVQPDTSPSSTTYHAVTRVLIRIFTIFAFLAISILFPAFDSIMAFMGSALCFQICVV